MRASVSTWTAVASWVLLVALCRADSSAAESFKIEFTTTVRAPSGSSFVVEVTPEWAPLGAARLKELAAHSFFDGAGFFRVVPKFVVQFGLAADPVNNAKWKKPIPDDPRIPAVGNTRGTVTFATSGKNTRTTQLFISLGENSFLDGMGFTPVGKVVSGLDVVEAITAQYGERPSQGEITARGSAYLAQYFPKLDYIKTAKLLD